jgi:uncharacterized delta-60 repeat protein
MPTVHVRRSSSSLHFATLESRRLLAATAPVVVPGWDESPVSVTAPLANGKTIGAGSLNASDGSGTVATFVARFNADGSIDRTFGTNGVTLRVIAWPDFNAVNPAFVRSVFVRGNGAILIQPERSNLWQVTNTGRLDSGFGGGDGVGALQTSETPNVARPNPDDLWFDAIRENADRSLSAVQYSAKTTFPSTGLQRVETRADLVTLSADGERIANSVALPRMQFVTTTNLATRASATTGVPFEVRDVDRLPNGSIVLTGSRETWSRERGATSRPAIFKFTPTGAADTTFGGTGVVTYFNVPSEDSGFASNTRPSAAGTLLTSITRSSSSGTTTQDYRVLAWGGLQIV